MTLYVGTSGWAYREWKPGFYPADLPQKRFLEHYSNSLDACEINVTFRKIQTPETFPRWVENTRAGFRFSVKAHRMLTHAKLLELNETRARFMKEFQESIKPLGERLAIVLYQFPPTRKRDDDGLNSLLDGHPSELPFACEFRNETWDDEAVATMLADRGGTVCISDTTGEVPSSLPPGRVGYVRMRSERYTEEQRAGWFELLSREGRKRDLFAFTKHEGIPAGDPYGGVGLARWMVDRRKASAVTPLGEVPAR